VVESGWRRKIWVVEHDGSKTKGKKLGLRKLEIISKNRLGFNPKEGRIKANW